MKNEVVFISIISIILVSIFSGCLEKSKDEAIDYQINTKYLEIDKILFLGTWQAQEPEDQIYNLTWIFYEDNSIKVSFNFQEQPFSYWGTYTAEYGKLILTSPKTNPATASYDYKFFNENNILVLSESGEVKLIFERVSNNPEEGDTFTEKNNDPVANDDAITVNQNSVNNEIDVIYNDIDTDFNEIYISSIGAPQYGSVTFTSRYIYYTPETNFYGKDQFDYTVTDGQGGSDNATVYVTVIKKDDGGSVTGVTMNIKEYTDNILLDSDWYSYFNFLLKTLDDGDTLIIQDKISTISYRPEVDATSITFCHWEGNTGVCESFYFEGDITNQYQKGDQIRITVHIKNVTFFGSRYNYDMEIFEEQWVSVSYFNSRVVHCLDFTKGLKPMSSSIITKL